MKVIKESFRLVLFPEKNTRDSWHELMAQVKRHIDFGDCHQECEKSVHCSHCGSTWEEDEDGPLCCDMAQQEHLAALASKEPPNGA